MTEAGQIRVLIVDDDPLVRSGLTMMLGGAARIEVVGEASNGLQAVSLAHSLSPEVVLMDVRMPELDGIAAAREILARDGARAPRVLMLSTFDLDE